MVKFVSEAYTLQDDTTCDLQISSAGELVVNTQYLLCMQEKKIGIGIKNICNKSLLFQHELLYIHVFMLY